MKALPWTLGAVVAFAAGCSQRTEPPVAVDPALADFVLDAPPEKIEHPSFVDFEGKVHLIGYDLEPEGRVEPGGTVDVKFYWRSVSKLSEGWGLFTHLANEYGHRVQNYDNVGPLRAMGSGRQALPPSLWEPGKVYVDEQKLEIPRQTEPWGEGVTRRVTLLVGVWKEGLRLDVVGGPTDGNNAAIVAHLSTGVEPAAPESAGTPGRASPQIKPHGG